MIVATWNVNSVRARLERLVHWLAEHQPDVLCLQEIKCTDEAFPFDALAGAGYRAAVLGQKTYNGVAILSRHELSDVRPGLDDGTEEPQSRLISAGIGGVRIFSVYVPNGGVVDADSYAYKLQWMRRLRQRLEERFRPSEPLILCGDFNVATDDRDVDQPAKWADTVICHSDARARLAEITRWGLVDVFRRHNPQGGKYSFWDYRQLAFPKNNGLRIDYIYATAAMAERCTGATIDRDERKGKKPSDHAPVTAVFED